MLRVGVVNLLDDICFTTKLLHALLLKTNLVSRELASRGEGGVWIKKVKYYLDERFPNGISSTGVDLGVA